MSERRLPQLRPVGLGIATSKEQAWCGRGIDSGSEKPKGLLLTVHLDGQASPVKPEIDTSSLTLLADRHLGIGG